MVQNIFSYVTFSWTKIVGKFGYDNTHFKIIPKKIPYFNAHPHLFQSIAKEKKI